MTDKMTIEQQMQKPEMQEPTPTSLIQDQLKTYFIHFHDRILNGHTDHERTEKDIKAEQALAYAYEVLVRNDLMSDLVHSQEYSPVRDGEKKLKGKTDVGEFFCIDGRIPRIFESFAINTWEKAAGVIRAERRESDGKLIPSSSSLCESIRGKIDKDDSERDILEISKAHYDSTSPEHGCAAINLITRALKREYGEYETANEDDKPIIEEDLVKKAELEEILTPEDIKAILDTPTPEDANLIVLEKINVEALTNYVNTIRSQYNLTELPRVGISGLVDTATFGFELRYNNQRISTTDLTNNHRKTIDSYAQTLDADFGKYNEVLSNPDLFIEFSHKLLALETEIIENENGRFDELNKEVNDYLNDNLGELTEGQKQALRFKMLRKVSLQYLTGLSELVDGKPNHPFAHHNEAYIAISVGGQFVGKYDLIEQQFGSSPANVETAVNETLVANLVMDKNNLKADETRVAFICSSVDSGDLNTNSNALRTARISNAEQIRGIVGENDKLKQLIKDGIIIPIPIILDQERKVVEVPDQSAYF